MSRQHWESDEGFEIPLTPLIDIVFILIIFFLVATTFYTEERDIEVKLAEGTEGELIAQENEAFVVNIRGTGVLVVRNQMVTEDELTEMLRTLARQANPKVEIRGDTTANHGGVMKVINLCKRHGIGNLSLTQRIVKESP